MGPTWKQPYANTYITGRQATRKLRAKELWLTSHDWTCSALTCPRLPWSYGWFGKWWKWVGGKLNFILSLSLTCCLFFNLTLHVKTSIPDRGDVTSSRAQGGRLRIEGPGANWFWFSSKSVKEFSFNASWSESYLEHDRTRRAGQ